ncbi:MAG: FAD:protein FMN transferase [Clostridiales bacterium]|nr:FAD:protein FMN transferase [Clostridiales bacterium]
MVMVCAMALTGCAGKKGTSENTASDEEPYSRDIFAMDTYMTVSAYGDAGEKAVDAAVKEINRLDALLSTGKASSEVSELNASNGGKLSADTNALMDAALDLYESTDHVFDITIYPVMKLWGFTDQNYKVPSEGDLKAALTLVDASTLDYNKAKKTVAFTVDGTQIDFGGIAKGYTSATVAQLYKDYGVTSGLVNLGGNVQTVGFKPDGSEWRIGIQDPEDENDMLGVVQTHDAAVITSGGYERNFEEDGVVYHHIIDPATGHPADNGLISVTIVSEDGTLADGLSTSLFIMGKAGAIEYWKAHSKDFDFVLCEDDGTLVVSKGLKDKFTPKDETAKVEYVS